MGVESILAPFMQQAEKYSRTDSPPDYRRGPLRSQRRPELVITARVPADLRAVAADQDDRLPRSRMGILWR